MHFLPLRALMLSNSACRFSDPMAEGIPIQLANQRALAAGQTMDKTLDMVREFRKQDEDTPIILMGYYNPIYVRDPNKFVQVAKEAGVDGFIIVDIPAEADDELCIPALEAGLNFIRLATPTTDDKRLPAVLANTSGFRILRLCDRHYRRQYC